MRTRVARVRAEYPNQQDYSRFCWAQEGATLDHSMRDKATSRLDIHLSSAGDELCLLWGVFLQLVTWCA